MKRKICSLFLILSMALSVSACSAADLAGIETYFISDEIVRENPLFWDTATLIDGQTSLYYLANESFQGKPYTEAFRYGDNILLVGLASYKYTNSTAASQEDEGEGLFEYSFGLYSPWRDAVIGEIEHDETTCDSYSITSDGRLLTYSQDENCFWLYDSTLNLVGTYSLDSLGSYDLSFANLEGDDLTFYTHNYEDNKLYSITLPATYTNSKEAETVRDVEATALDAPLLSTFSIETCDDGKALLLSGIEADTLKEVLLFYTPEDGILSYAATAYNGMEGDYQSDSYITRVSAYRPYWKVYTSDGSTRYFSDGDANSYDLLSDGSLLREAVNYEENSTTVTLSRYTTDGSCSNKVTYQSSASDIEELYYPSNPVVFEEDSLTFVLEAASAGSPHLLVWDLKTETASDDCLALSDDFTKMECDYLTNLAQSSDENVNVYTTLSDTSSYDWGELTSVRQKADELEETYGIEIYLGDTIPDKIDLYSIGKMKDSDTIMEALLAFEDVLSAYPDDFFRQLCYSDLTSLKFYFGGDLKADSEGMLTEAAAYVTQIEQYRVMVLDCNYFWDWTYTVNHELSHMIDARLEYYNTYNQSSLFSSDGWSALNPPEFSYLETYDSYESNPDYTTYSDYFIDAYGTTFATEDRAELFGKAMVYATDGDAENTSDLFNNVRSAKFYYYCQGIRDAFDDHLWPDLLPWEEVLEQ